jgi:TolB-like protein/Tfp pilus assembly protein PilF
MQKDSASSTIIRFSTFELDVRAGELRKQGVKIKLQEQPLRILEMLLAHPGQLVTREELRTRLWPSDTFVDFDHSLNKAINKLREALGDSAESPRFIETLSRRGYRFLGDLSADRQGIRSLLVMPLENLSGDPEQEYFAEGLTEVLTTNLAKIAALRVVSRITAKVYKNAQKPLPQIARELDVDGIIEGSVMRSEGRVRISAQLVHAPTDSHLWAESYERDLGNVLALQSEIAQAIAREIQVKLQPQEQAHFAHARRVDPAAYEAHLKGQYYFNIRTPRGFNKAIECFEEAISKDPTYADAYSGLADCLCVKSHWGYLPPEEGSGRAKGLAVQALALDPALAQAHASLAWAAFNYDWDFATMDREFRRSIELDPSYDSARRWYGMSLAMMGRYEEARIQLEQAIRLDPCSSGHHFVFGLVHWIAREHEEAIKEYEKSLELEPDFPQTHWGLGLALLAQRNDVAAIAHLQKSCETSHNAPTPLLGLAEGYAVVGDSNEARDILARQQEITNQSYRIPYMNARVHAGLGEKSTALDWLETAYRARAQWMPLLKMDLRFDTLRSEPRFQDLLRRVNYPTV